MMNRLLTLIALSASCSASLADENLIRALAKQTGLPEARIVEHHRTGCDSGVHLLMQICAQYSYLEADAKLNKTYNALMKRLANVPDREDLRNSQRAWIPFRDAQCRLDTSAWRVGSFSLTATAICLKAQTEARESTLASYMKCPIELCTEISDIPSETTSLPKATAK